MSFRRVRHLFSVLGCAVAISSCSSPAAPVSASAPTRTAATSTGTITARLQGNHVSAPRAAVSFEIPAHWTVIDPAAAARVSASTLPDSVRNLAAQSGLTVEEYVQQMGASIEIVAMGPRQKDYVNTVSVLPTPLRVLPPIDQIRDGLQASGATVTRVDLTTTPIGPALVAQMTMTVGSSRANQQVIVVQHTGRVTILTAAAREWAAADDLSRTVIGSLTEP